MDQGCWIEASFLRRWVHLEQAHSGWLEWEPASQLSHLFLMITSKNDVKSKQVVTK